MSQMPTHRIPLEDVPQFMHASIARAIYGNADEGFVNLSPDDILDAWLKYEGIIGYTGTIIDACKAMAAIKARNEADAGNARYKGAQMATPEERKEFEDITRQNKTSEAMDVARYNRETQLLTAMVSNATARTLLSPGAIKDFVAKLM